MAEDKKVTFGVDDKAVQQYQNRLRQSAEQLARGMVSDARAYTTSSREVISSIEEQIRAIEKRNKLDEEFRKSRLESAREGGHIDKGQYKSRMTEIKAESREDKLQTQLLKEILDESKRSAKEQLREDRVNVEKRLHASRTAGALRPEGDELEILKESIQADEVGRLKELEQRGASGRGRGMGMPITGADIFGARDAGDLAVRGVSGGVGMLGGAAGGFLAALGIDKLLGAAVSGAREVEGALSGAYGYTGQAVQSASLRGYDVNALAAMGMTPADVIRGRTDLYGGARTMNLGESATNLLALEKATPLGRGDITGMVGLRRHGSDITASGGSEFFTKYLERTGQDVAGLSEIVGQFVNESRQQIMRTGSFDSASLGQAMSNFGAQTGLSGEAMSGAFGAFRQGMQRSSNPVIQALQYQAARRAGATSLGDMERMMESPLDSKEGLAYVNEMMSSLRATTGGGEQFHRAIRNMGIAPTLAMAEKMAGVYDIDKELTKEQLGLLKGDRISQQGKATEGTGALEESQARVAGTTQRETFEGVQDLVKKLDEQMEKFVDFLDGFRDWKEENKEVIEESTKKVVDAVNNVNVRVPMYSDIRLKENIKELQPSLKDILKIRTVFYDFNEKGKHLTGVEKESGIIAQELQSIFPDLVEEKCGYLHVKYQKLTTYLIKGIQEMDERFNEQEKRIERLEELIK